MSNDAFLLAGDLYFNPIDNVTGLPLGKMGPYPCSKFEIKPNSEIKEAISKGRNTYGQPVATVALAKPADIAIELTKMDAYGLMLALSGTAEEYAQGAGTVSDVPLALTAAKMDKWQDLGHENINAAGFVVTNNAASTTYTEGTDYMVNRVLGMIKALSTGTIPSTETIKIDYGYAAVDGTRILGGTQAQVKGAFQLDGLNLVSNLPVEANAWEVVMKNDAGIDFLADDFGKVVLTGRANVVVGKDAPFEVKARKASA